MLRSLGSRASFLQMGAADPTQRMDFIFVAFSNHETTKRREIHEIFESRLVGKAWRSLPLIYSRAAKGKSCEAILSKSPNRLSFFLI